MSLVRITVVAFALIVIGRGVFLWLGPEGLFLAVIAFVIAAALTNGGSRWGSL